MLASSTWWNPAEIVSSAGVGRSERAPNLPVQRLPAAPAPWESAPRTAVTTAPAAAGAKVSSTPALAVTTAAVGVMAWAAVAAVAVAPAAAHTEARPEPAALPVQFAFVVVSVWPAGDAVAAAAIA